jgi:hypothetical protein
MVEIYLKSKPDLYSRTGVTTWTFSPKKKKRARTESKTEEDKKIEEASVQPTGESPRTTKKRRKKKSQTESESEKDAHVTEISCAVNGRDPENDPDAMDPSRIYTQHHREDSYTITEDCDKISEAAPDNQSTDAHLKHEEEDKVTGVDLSLDIELAECNDHEMDRILEELYAIYSELEPLIHQYVLYRCVLPC